MIVPILVSFVLAGCFALVLIGFNGFNFYLVLSGQTQLEFYTSGFKKMKCKREGTVL